jgi:HPt (histidine-containing phosphotransfer) domain-containing protein
METMTGTSTGRGREIVDRAALLDRAGGDEDLLREVCAIFLTEYPMLIEEIRSAIRAGDAQHLEHAAHSLKGSVSNFGAPAATEAAYRLESIGRRCELSSAPAALTELLLQLQQLRPELEDFSS